MTAETDLGEQTSGPRRPPAPIANPDSLDMLHEDDFDPSRPKPVEVTASGLDIDDCEWASNHGLIKLPRSREGADFLRLTDDVYIIPVRGGQILHHDRHLAHEESAGHFSEHTWNLVVEGSDEQLLVTETDHGIFEHFSLAQNTFIYFNTMNRHLVTRKSSDDAVVIVQVEGYGPDEGELALDRLKAVLAARPHPTPLHPTIG